MSVSKIAQQRGLILDEIMRYHRENLPKVKRAVPLSQVRAFARVAQPAGDFAAALRDAPGVALIAECKRASPSKGLLVRKYDPVGLAKMYVEGGASAISVLTDARHFQGALSHLRDIKETLPEALVLRKDFIFDPYQVYEARAAGADAVLLITRVLSTAVMRDLLSLTHDLGMHALVEVHSAAELERILPLAPRIVGVNNRNLQTFTVDFENTARLRALIPTGVLVVAESGLKTSADVMAMRAIGVDAMLVGETIVTSKEPLRVVKELVRTGRYGQK